jgi:hypothetical protein
MPRIGGSSPLKPAPGDVCPRLHLNRAVRLSFAVLFGQLLIETRRSGRSGRLDECYRAGVGSSVANWHRGFRVQMNQAVLGALADVDGRRLGPRLGPHGGIRGHVAHGAAAFGQLSGRCSDTAGRDRSTRRRVSVSREASPASCASASRSRSTRWSTRRGHSCASARTARLLPRIRGRPRRSPCRQRHRGRPRDDRAVRLLHDDGDPAVVGAASHTTRRRGSGSVIPLEQSPGPAC